MAIKKYLVKTCKQTCYWTPSRRKNWRYWGRRKGVISRRAITLLVQLRNAQTGEYLYLGSDNLSHDRTVGGIAADRHVEGRHLPRPVHQRPLPGRLPIPGHGRQGPPCVFTWRKISNPSNCGPTVPPVRCWWTLTASTPNSTRTATHFSTWSAGNTCTWLATN